MAPQQCYIVAVPDGVVRKCRPFFTVNITVSIFPKIALVLMGTLPCVNVD